jgi:hypothetical protein
MSDDPAADAEAALAQVVMLGADDEPTPAALALGESVARHVVERSRPEDSLEADVLAHHIAGLLSTFPPHDQAHPEDCLPMAYAVVRALEDWKP